MLEILWWTFLLALEKPRPGKDMQWDMDPAEILEDDDDAWRAPVCGKSVS